MILFYKTLFAGFSQDEELRPDFEDLSSEAAWQSVVETIEQHESGQRKHCLHLTAVQAALAKERRLKLPPALLAPFQACFQAPHKTACLWAFTGPGVVSVQCQHHVPPGFDKCADETPANLHLLTDWEGFCESQQKSSEVISVL